MRLPIRPPSKPPTTAPPRRFPGPATAAPSTAPVPAPSKVPVPSFGPGPIPSGLPAQAASVRPTMAKVANLAANLDTDISTPGNRCSERRTRHGWRTISLSRREDSCLLYTSDAADEEDSVDLGGRR